jgi:predicted DNA binding CopG/RHH family protein
MSPKKVNFGRKPETQEPVDVEKWVSERSSAMSLPTEEQPEKMKRITLDIPESLHKAIKRQAVDAGVTMADLLRELLEQHYGTKQ